MNVMGGIGNNKAVRPPILTVSVADQLYRWVERQRKTLVLIATDLAGPRTEII